MPDTVQTFISKYWQILIWIISAIFVAGGLYAEFLYLTIRNRSNKPTFS